MLADVFAEPDDVPVSSTTAPGSTVPVEADCPSPMDGDAKFPGLDTNLHPILEQLVTRVEWSSTQVRELARQHRMMPNAILEGINSWSEEAAGDVLLDEQGDSWIVHAELLRRMMQ
jgi:hypothetical protein